MLYKLCENKIDNKAFEKNIKSAVGCEQSFIGDSFPVDLIAMNSKLMKEFITFVADRLCYVLVGKSETFEDIFDENENEIDCDKLAYNILFDTIIKCYNECIKNCI